MFLFILILFTLRLLCRDQQLLQKWRKKRAGRSTALRGGKEQFLYLCPLGGQALLTLIEDFSTFSEIKPQVCKGDMTLYSGPVGTRAADLRLDR